MALYHWFIGVHYFRASPHSPTPFETFIWDHLRLSQHFKILWNNSDLTNKLFNTYLLISGANSRMNLLNVAVNNVIINPNRTTQSVSSNATKMLNDFLVKDVLPKIKETQDSLSIFRNSL